MLLTRSSELTRSAHRRSSAKKQGHRRYARCARWNSDLHRSAFEWTYGAAAVIAVFHDVLVTLGFFSIFQIEVSLNVIAALLTLVGFSVNDTIVVFDRIRENRKLHRRDSLYKITNDSINQTLSRTVITNGLVFLIGAGPGAFGGDVLRGIFAGAVHRCGLWYLFVDRDCESDHGLVGAANRSSESRAALSFNQPRVRRRAPRRRETEFSRRFKAKRAMFRA
jgi:hypothetical protein